ncbi:MAG TPA: choice-of-anchor Q domain-containing protein [Lysobacter sp.]
MSGSTTSSVIFRGLIGLAFATAALRPGDVQAATLPVSNCEDSGAGSLREAVATAMEGDTVDLSALECNPVALTSGQIEVPQDNLEMIGRQGITIDANRTGRVIHHSGTGTLCIDRLLLTNGLYVANFATGGCLHSDGNVELVSSTVDSCQALGEGGTDPVALGGGVYANTALIRHSALSSNKAAGGAGHGGGISTVGRVTIFRSSVMFNEASAGAGVSTLGGATVTYSSISSNLARNNAGMEASGGSVTINKSSFMSNEAQLRCGAICVLGTGRTSILDSTFSRNLATFLSVGALSDDATISNSTIAFNVEQSGNECTGTIRARQLRMQSTIAASNACVASMQAYDVGGRPWEGYTLTGANNLIGRSLVGVPADTISADPRLEVTPAFNGGPTFTHLLLSDSPAIDRGNNVFNRQYDQRGPGFPRVKGVRADIGAVEF